MRSSNGDMVRAVNFFVIDIVTVVTVGFESESGSANVAFEAALMKKRGILKRSNLVRRVDLFSAPIAVLFRVHSRSE